MPKLRYIGLDCLYCDKWRKISESHCDLDLDRQCPMLNSSKAIFFVYYNYVLVSSGLNHYFFSYRVHRHKHTHTDTHTDGHEYSIVAVLYVCYNIFLSQYNKSVSNMLLPHSISCLQDQTRSDKMV